MSKETSCEEPLVKRQRFQIAVSNSPLSANNSCSNDSHDEDQIEASLSLNYDCWWKIIHFCDIKTLCQLANVCKEFRTMAEDFFRRNPIKFEPSGYNRTSFRRVLCKFGHLIKSLDMHDNWGPMNAIDAGDINKYCPNLEHFRLRHMTISCDSSEPIFKRLKTLQINSCPLVGQIKELLKHCWELEDLLVTDGNIRDILYCFPKLKTLTFKNYRVETSSFYTFLKLNPNLKQLHGIFTLNNECILAIVQNVPNLEVLKLSYAFNMSKQDLTTEGLLKLANLKKLRRLKLTGFANKCSLMEFMAAFSSANVPIEKLTLGVFRIGQVRNISNLKTIHTLKLRWVSCYDEDHLISLLNQLPQLEKLELALCPYTVLSVSIFDAFKATNTCIKELTLDRFKITSTSIQSISNIKSLHVLRMLDLNENAHISDRDLIQLVSKLPLLEEIEVKCFYRRDISVTVDGLKKLIENGNQLKCIKLSSAKDLHTDRTAIVSILDAIEINRNLLIDFEGCEHKTSFVVPDDQKKSRIYKFKSPDKRLEIIYRQEYCDCSI